MLIGLQKVFWTKAAPAVTVGEGVQVDEIVGEIVKVAERLGLAEIVGEEVLLTTTVLLGVGDIVGVLVAVGAPAWGMIWMALILALSTLAGPSWIMICPPTGAMLLNTLSSAIYRPPALAKISKFDNTWEPLMETLKIRLLGPLYQISANFSVT
jgi:hypothetical protein